MAGRGSCDLGTHGGLRELSWSLSAVALTQPPEMEFEGNIASKVENNGENPPLISGVPRALQGNKLLSLFPTWMTTSIPRDTRELQSLALSSVLLCYQGCQTIQLLFTTQPPNLQKRKKNKNPSSYISKHQKYSPGKLEALSSSRLMHCLAGGVHKNELLAAFGVQLGRPSLRNELAFADRQAQSDGVTPKGSEGIFHCFSWRVSLAARNRSRRALRQRGPWHKAAIWAGDVCWALCEYMPACLLHDYVIQGP